METYLATGRHGVPTFINSEPQKFIAIFRQHEEDNLCNQRTPKLSWFFM